jgi:hypothetical protein
MAALLHERLADMAIGPRLSGDIAAALVSEPVFRYRLLVVAGATHRLATRATVPLGALAGEDWLVDPAGADPSTEVGMLLAHLHVPVERTRVFPSQARRGRQPDGQGRGDRPPGAASRLRQPRAVARGRHTRRLYWYATTLPSDRRPAGAGGSTTPDAMQAMHRSRASRRAASVRRST